MLAKLPETDTEIKNLPASVDKLRDSRVYVVAYESGEFSIPIELRIYYPRKSDGRVRAALWVRAGGKYFAGAGSAGGYGYNKPSAAAGAAISAAGIELSQDIEGRGEETVFEALRAIARAAGFSVFHVVGRV